MPVNILCLGTGVLSKSGEKKASLSRVETGLGYGESVELSRGETSSLGYDEGLRLEVSS
jgi:hypothetical protein